MIPLLWLLACGQRDATPDPGAPGASGTGAFTLIYTGNLDGEIEPCG